MLAVVALVGVVTAVRATSSAAAGCSDPSGQCLPSTPAGYQPVCLDDFTVNAPTGSWNDPTGSGNAVVYTGDHRCQWTTYPDGWRAGDQFGGIYEPSQVLSVHDGVLDFFFHQVNGQPSAAAVAPNVANGRPFQTYGIYEFRAKVVYNDAHHLDDYYLVPLLWPQSDGNWQYAESDFPEGHLNGPTFSAFAHFGGSGAQDEFDFNTDLTQWHTFMQVWKPGERDYYVDGTLVGTSTNQVYSSPESWYLQTEADDSLPNDGTTGHLDVDWAAVYSPCSSCSGGGPAPAPPTPSSGSGPSTFVRTSSGALVEYWYSQGTWLSSVVVGSGVMSQPAVVLQPDGEPSVFFEGPGGSLMNYWYSNGVWGGAEVATGGTGSTPVVLLQGNGAPTVFVQGPGHSLLNYWYIPSQGVWGAGTVAGSGSTFSAPALLFQTNGAPSVFVQGPGNALLNYWYIPALGTWGAGTVGPVGSTYSDPEALSQVDGAPSLFVEGPGNSLLNYWYVPSQGVWGAGTVANPGSTFSAPALTAQADGAPSLFVEGPGNSLLNYWYVPSQGVWGAGTVGGSDSAYAKPNVTPQPDGTPSVFVAGPGGSLLNFGYDPGLGTWGAATVATTGIS